MKTNPFHQTIIVTGGAAGIGYAVSLSSVRLTSCSTAVPARNWPAPLKNEVMYGEQCLLNLPVAVSAFEQRFIGDKT